MILGKEKATKFYALLSGLANYVNKTRKIHPDMPDKDYYQISGEDMQKCLDIQSYTWAHPEVIDEYLKSDGSGLCEEDQQTVAGWKRRRTGRFIAERQLKSGAVLLSADPEMEDQAFLVQGFFGGFDDYGEQVGLRLPICVDACLLPFDGVIVTDGLVHVLPITYGSGMRAQFKEYYREAKQKGNVLKQL